MANTQCVGGGRAADGDHIAIIEELTDRLEEACDQLDLFRKGKGCDQVAWSIVEVASTEIMFGRAAIKAAKKAAIKAAKLKPEAK